MKGRASGSGSRESGNPTQAHLALPAHSPFPISAGRQTGYTLIEVIVAFGVLALGLTLLLGTLSGATRQVRNADDAGRAALHAQSLLDQIGVGEVLQPGRRDGEFEQGRYRWVLDVQPYRDPTAPAAAPVELAAPQLMQLALTVQWGEGARERLQVQSLRLVAPDAAAGVALP
ncbi:MAG TPA: prepilin-type N-terminal cleavage/methylation domain-containing protein [Xanthomonadaceae bacterium]|nr:prepilin-type N-terminal cleavage/methylation domain-containing protein [Xanthomonadaceae bacterium]